MKKLIVLGPGCPRCETLAKLTRQAADQLGIDYELEKLTDIKQFAKLRPDDDPGSGRRRRAQGPGQGPVARRDQGHAGVGGDHASPTASVSLSSLALLLVAAVLGFAPCGRAAEQPAGPDAAAAAAELREFVAYYFHGNVRCATCRKLEAYSEEAITKGFADELASGTLAWRVVNIDEPENKHFVQDFELVTKSLVLVEYRDGEVVRFAEPRARSGSWSATRTASSTYVRDATREFLEES